MSACEARQSLLNFVREQWLPFEHTEDSWKVVFEVQSPHRSQDGQNEIEADCVVERCRIKVELNLAEINGRLLVKFARKGGSGTLFHQTVDQMKELLIEE